MRNIDVLIKAVTLLHREYTLGEASVDNSKDLIKTTLELFDNGNDRSNQLIGGDSNIISDLKELLKDMISSPDNYDKVSLLQSLEIILKDKDSLLKVVNKTINTDLQVRDLKRTIISLRNILNNHYKDQSIKKVISRASYQINTNNIGDVTMPQFVAELITNLDALSITTTTKDPGIVDEQDVGDVNTLNVVLNRVKDSDGSGRLLTGWKELNDMTQGGFRRGATIIVNALQHSYKSGFVQSLFMQFCTCNIPVLKDPGKKPLMVYISAEDDSDVYTEFMYRYLYNNEFKKAPDLSTVTSDEISTYIKKKLGVNGYHAKMYRINPNEWTYKNIFNLILKLESEGYEIHGCIIDYLSKIPTTGCISTGGTGTDIRDLYNRIRNFMSAKAITMLSPHQLSSDAKQLIRNGVPGMEFVKEIAGKGYTEGSKQLDQVVDMEIYLHKTTVNRKWVLTVGRGKDRQPGILDDDKMYFVLPFPHKAPILENVNETSDEIGIENGSPIENKEFDY